MKKNTAKPPRKQPQGNPTSAPAKSPNPPTPPAARTSSADSPLLAALAPWLPWLALAAIAFIVYLPALGAGFIWDDDALTANTFVNSSTGLFKIWLTPRLMIQEQHYWPLVYTTFWLERLVAGLNPFIYHLDNNLLFCGVALLLWRVLRRLELPAAWFAAALFAVHPIHVESVAWVIERKDVLNGVFTLGAALAFLRFADPAEPHRTRFYVLSLILFAAAMLSKSAGVGLPLALGLALWWRRGRLTLRDLAALLPLLLVAVVLTLVDLRHLATLRDPGAYGSGLPLLGRVVLAGRAIWEYLLKLAIPWPLATFYPQWTVRTASVFAWLPLLAWLALVAGLWLVRRRLGRGPFTAVAFYSLMLGPALGVMDFDYLYNTYIADRFQFLASIGPLALAAAGIVALAARFRWPATTLHYGQVALLALLGLLCLRQASFYHDSVWLFRASIAAAPSCWPAYTNLAWALGQEGKTEEGNDVLRNAIKTMSPPSPKLTLELAGTLALQKRFDEADHYYRETLRLAPNFMEGLTSYGTFLAYHGNPDGAVKLYQQALAINPDQPLALANMGNVLHSQGKVDEAVRSLKHAIRIAPWFVGYRVDLADALIDLKDYEGALEQCRAARRLDPNFAGGPLTEGKALLAQSKGSEAEASIKEALQLMPPTADALYNLGQAFQMQSKIAAAAQSYQQALQFQPDFAPAQDRLRSLGFTPK